MKNEAQWRKEYGEAAGDYGSRHRQARMLRFFAKHASGKAKARQLRNYRRAEKRMLAQRRAARLAWSRAPARGMSARTGR